MDTLRLGFRMGRAGLGNRSRGLGLRRERPILGTERRTGDMGIAIRRKVVLVGPIDRHGGNCLLIGRTGSCFGNECSRSRFEWFGRPAVALRPVRIGGRVRQTQPNA